MKKVYTTTEYKIKHQRRLLKYQQKYRPLHSRRLANKKNVYEGKSINSLQNDIPVFAPRDLRLLESTSDCLAFFREIRNEENINISRNGSKYVGMSLKNVEKIDYGAISVLTAISDDLKLKNVILKGDFPLNESCKLFFIESGFLSHMFNDKGLPFTHTKNSELIFFEKGYGKLSVKDNIRISDTIKRVVHHLTGDLKQCLPVKSIILEICGNSIEWGGTLNKQWLFGAKYEEDRVVLTVTDVGKGILETLNRKFAHVLGDTFTMKTASEILEGAFNQKYGSSSREVNRNKGLPAVKHNFDVGTIDNLKVLTNNVILHFDDSTKSRTFKKGEPRFRGTLYQWVMTRDCLQKLENKVYASIENI